MARATFSARTGTTIPGLGSKTTCKALVSSFGKTEISTSVNLQPTSATGQTNSWKRAQETNTSGPGKTTKSMVRANTSTRTGINLLGTIC